MLRAVVIDDEPMALEVIRAFTEKVIFIEVTGYFTNGFEALNFLKSNAVDLIFLDIKMPDISSIELARSLQNPPMIIFTTAYSEHAVESFELNTVDYLLKPFSLARFLKACNKAWEQYQLKIRKPAGAHMPDEVYIKDGYDLVRVDLNDIRYAEGNGNYVDFVLEKKKITSRLTMTEAEALLPGSGFIRVHRSYIVAKKHIQKINKKSLRIGPVDIPIGASYGDDLEKLIR